MNFEEAANPIIEKFINELIEKLMNDAREKTTHLENELTNKLNEYKEDLIGALKEYSEQWEKGGTVDAQHVGQLSLSLEKLIPAPLPPEETFIVQAQKAWNDLELASNQAEALGILIEKVGRRCDGTAIFILRGDKVMGWKASNLSTDNFGDADINKISLDFAEGTSFYHSQQSYSYISFNPGYFSGDTILLEKMGGRKAQNIGIYPLIIKGRCVGFLYIDSLDEAIDMETLAYVELLATLTSLAIETFSTRQNMIATKKATRVVKAEDKAPEIAEIEAKQEVAEQQRIESSVQEEPEATRIQDVSPEAEVNAADQEEVEVSEQLEEVSEAEEVQEIEEVTEVEEIQEVAEAIPSEEENKLHEEAKRFARLLVSEIKLYNEAQVALGRENKDLFERLKDDIERSRKMYMERISPKIASTTNYFHDELVKTLAGGDPSALGVDNK